MSFELWLQLYNQPLKHVSTMWAFVFTLCLSSLCENFNLLRNHWANGTKLGRVGPWKEIQIRTSKNKTTWLLLWGWFTQYTPLQFLQTKTSHDQKSVKCIYFIHWLPFYFWQTIKSEIWLRVVFNTHDNNISDFLDYFLLISMQNVYKCIVKDLKTKHLHFIMITSLYFTQKC